MLTDILKTIEDCNMLRSGERVLVAFSGGVDSAVLLDALIKLSEKLGITVAAAHLNHMLRGADADADERFAEEKCREYGIPFLSSRRDINVLSKERGESVELCARNERYDFLRTAAEKLGADKIATAHNANDNLETILFNISRGSGLDGLCGIPPVRGDIIRPLINTSRAEIERYAEENEIEFRTDKTNFETVYSRNKLRHNAIPSLSEVNASAVENAARAAQILRHEADFIRLKAEEAAREISAGENSCRGDMLLALHSALFGRVCEIYAKNALEREDITLEFRHVESIKKLLSSDNPSGMISLPSSLLVRREYEKLVFEKAEEGSCAEKISVREGEFSFGDYSVHIRKKKNTDKIHKSLNLFLIPCDKIEGELVLRPRCEGDDIKLSNRPTKTIKKMFIEAKVPKHLREKIPVIADDEKVFAVFGFGCDVRRCAQSEETVYEIEIELGAGINEK